MKEISPFLFQNWLWWSIFIRAYWLYLLSMSFSNGIADFYFLYVVIPIFYLIGTFHIYEKQKDCLKPQIILIIINLIDISLHSIVLGIYIFFLKALDLSSTALEIFNCVVILLAFFKSMDNILGQIDAFLSIGKVKKKIK